MDTSKPLEDLSILIQKIYKWEARMSDILNLVLDQAKSLNRFDWSVLSKTPAISQCVTDLTRKQPVTSSFSTASSQVYVSAFKPSHWTMDFAGFLKEMPVVDAFLSHLSFNTVL